MSVVREATVEDGSQSHFETDADRLASESLIPSARWQAAHLGPRSTLDQVEAFARELKISPAIPAGRIRHEARDHRVFWRLVGNGQVRAQLAEAVE